MSGSIFSLANPSRISSCLISKWITCTMSNEYHDTIHNMPSHFVVDVYHRHCLLLLLLLLNGTWSTSVFFSTSFFILPFWCYYYIFILNVSLATITLFSHNNIRMIWSHLENNIRLYLSSWHSAVTRKKKETKMIFFHIKCNYCYYHFERNETHCKTLYQFSIMLQCAVTLQTCQSK